MARFSNRLTLLPAALFLATAYRSDGADQGGTSGTSRVYIMQAGEGIADVAQRYLGNSDLGNELLKLNGLANPAALVPGTVIALPGRERDDALVAMKEALDSLLVVVTNGSAAFAQEEVTRARASLGRAEEAFVDAAYDKATALAAVTKELARQALLLAEQRAASQPEAAIRAAFGTVEVSSDGRTWIEAPAGRQVPMGSMVRTGERSRAELLMPEGSVVTLQENAQVVLDDLFRDLRQGRTRMMMRLLMGEIMGEFEKLPTPESKFELKAAGSSIAIRGTDLRVGLDAESRTTLCLEEGRVEARARKTSVNLKSGQGLLISRGGKPSRPMPLLPAPTLRRPGPAPFSTADQTVELSWESPATGRVADYRVEVARDESFLQIVANQPVRQRDWTTGILDAGRYYWRVLGRNHLGLEGYWSLPGVLDIERHLEVTSRLSGRAVETRGTVFARPGSTLVAQAARQDTSVVHIEARVNRREPVPVSGGGLPFVEEGTYRVEVRGVGADGETGPPQQLAFVVDGTPPAIRMRALPDPERRKLVVEFDVRDDSGVASARYKTVRKGRMVVHTKSATPVGYLDRHSRFAEYLVPLHLDWPARHDIYLCAADALGNSTGCQAYRIRPDAHAPDGFSVTHK